MSRTNGNSAHGRSCPCGRCRSDYVSSPGMGFGADDLQQDVGPGSLIRTPTPPQAPQAQIDQGRQDFHAIMDEPQLSQLHTGGGLWADPSAWRTASREGTLPPQYAYATAMEIGTSITPTGHQTRANVPNSTQITAATQHPAARAAEGSFAPPNTPFTQPGERTQNQAQTSRGSRSSYSMSSAPRGRVPSTNATNRTSHSSRRMEQQRQTTSRLSRQSQSVAETTPEPDDSSSEDMAES